METKKTYLVAALTVPLQPGAAAPVAAIKKWKNVVTI